MSKKRQETALAVVEAVSEEHALTSKEQAEGHKRYQERLVYFDKQGVNCNRQVLMTSWETGQMVDELLKNARKYGNRTVEHFATDLKRLELRALGKSEDEINAAKSSADVLRIHHRYYQRYPDRASVEEHVNLRLSWGAVHLLIGVGDARKRELILKKYLDYRDHPDAEVAITRKKLAAMVKSATKITREDAKIAGVEVSHRGGATLTSTVRTTSAMSDDFAQKLEEFRLAIKEFSAQTEDKRDPKLVLRVKEAHKMLVALRQKLDDALKLFG